MDSATLVTEATVRLEFGRQPSLKILQDRIRDALLRNASVPSPNNLISDATKHYGHRTQAEFHKYKFGRVLGKGSYGEVIQAKDFQGKLYAIKVLREMNCGKEDIVWEVKILKMLKKLNCGKFKCAELIKSFHLGNEAYIYLQFPLFGPALIDRIHISKDDECYSCRPGNGFPLDQINDILRQMFSAVDFLHRHYIAHTDIKTDNILFVDGKFCTVYEKETNKFRIKMNSTEVRLIDFGLAVIRPETKNITRRCAPMYKPPEAIFNTGISYPLDIWCLGIVGAAMYLGRELFKFESENSSLELLAQMEIVLGPFPSDIIQSPYAQQFFLDGKVKVLPGCIKHLIAESVPLNELKKSASPGTDRLFTLLRKMLSLDSRIRPTIAELLSNTKGEGAAIF